MIKVALIGAGSVVFSKNLTGDILSYPEFKNATLSYMDIDGDRLKVAAAMCKKVGQAVGAEPKIMATADRKKALDGADFVINTVQIGGFNSTLVDFEIPRKYGLNFTIADTTGPGGLFRALRTYPMLRGLCQDMQAVCPNALLLNYSNPMSMNMQTITRTSSIKAVGLCHSVQSTFDHLMGYIGENPHDPAISFLCGGINHMAFYLQMRKAGTDLYPRLFKAMEDPKNFNSNKVRFELMKRLGYFITESSEHNAEYCPYFIPRGEQMIKQFGVPIDEYLRRCDGIVDEFERLKKFSRTDEPIKVTRSHEYGSLIIHSMVTNTPRVVYGNMPNNGAISNLPDSAIAEAPTLVDNSGCQFTTVGELPPQLVGYMQPHVTQHELFIRAAMEGRRDHVYQAAMFDPLTAATLSLDKIVEMCDELIACHGKDLPKLAHKGLVPGSGRTFKPTKAQALRDSWDKAQKAAAGEVVGQWHVIGPFPGRKPRHISLNEPTPIDEVIARSGDGRISLTDTYQLNGEALKWQKVEVSAKRGFINLGSVLGSHEYAMAYGYAEVEAIHPRETILHCGSDDGIKVWLNGQLIHTHDIQRGYVAKEDKVAVQLQEGINRILVKVDNYIAGWGFGVTIDAANF
ncbi:MAG: alpha-glucosidase/alpha-galactosidase [Phycisphaeraceae bacterium]